MAAVLEDATPIELTEWGTLNTAAPSMKLPVGQSPDMDNVWVDEKPGSVITANGLRKVGTTPSGNPPTLCLTYFKTSDGTQIFLVSDNATVWKTVNFVDFTQIITGLSASFQLRARVIRDKVWFTNGSDAVRIYDGTTVTVLDGTGGTPNVPKGRFIEYKDERVWLFHIAGDRSKLCFSALADNTGAAITPDNASAWPSSTNLQISEGDNDFGTGMRYYNSYLYCFKQGTIWRIVGYDESNYSRVKTKAFTGTRFSESIQELDNVLKFIGVDGFYEFDGENVTRISDLIDPADTSSGTFGFKDLQQPFLNNSFWSLSDAADFNSGTMPINLLSANKRLSLAAADDTQQDFGLGSIPLWNHIDLSIAPGNVALSNSDTAGTAANGNLAANCKVTASAAPSSGQLAALTDDFGLTQVTWNFQLGVAGLAIWITTIDLGSFQYFGQIVLRKFILGPVTPGGAGGMMLGGLSVQGDTTGNGNWVAFGKVSPALGVSQDLVIGSQNFSYPIAVRYVRVFAVVGSGTAIHFNQFEFQKIGYAPAGKFVSRTMNYGVVPNSYGTFAATVALNGQSVSFFTQSSADGVTWDGEVAVTVGGAIGSTVRQYLRWGAYLNSNGTQSPQIDAVYVMGLYLSPIHNCGASIYAWGAYEVGQTFNAGAISHFYRAAATEGGVAGASWVAIVPGAALTTNVANQYVQFKTEVSATDSTRLPFVSDVTINWINTSGTAVQTLQNVSSIVWHNRYWLSAARRGAASNDIIVIRGKKTYSSPWMKKSWNILSFATYQGNLYGGSSVDGSIYRLDTGTSLDGKAMDSYFQTGEFTKGGFIFQVMEADVSVERTGPYNLMFGISTDNGKTWTEKAIDLTPTGGATMYTKKLAFNITTEKFRVRVRTNGLDQPFQVHSAVLWYQASASRGSIN